MKKSATISTRTLGLAVAGVPLLLAAVAGAAYWAGHDEAARQAQGRQIVRENIFANEKNREQSEMGRLESDYQSACYNYQTLYAAYDELYKKAGAEAGATHVVRPDSARGNEESCYR